MKGMISKGKKQALLKKLKEKNKEVVIKQETTETATSSYTNLGKKLALNPDPFKSSIERAREFFQWIIHPTPIQKFYSDYFEQKPLLIKRKNPDYYSTWWTREEITEGINSTTLHYGIDIDLVCYKNGIRENLKVGEQIKSEEMWDFVDNQKCSIRVLRPQEFSKDLSTMLNILDEFFHSNAGVNSYYTPPGAQGFAPHWDDVDVFMLQTEGSKRWKIYKPSEKTKLPRYSSKD